MKKNNLYPLQPIFEHNDYIFIFCPFAGAVSHVFHSWNNIENKWMNMYCYLYPGHDLRMKEAYKTDIASLANELAETIQSTEWSQKKIILGGHSMGSQVAFETCRVLEQQGVTVSALILSGCHAPHLTGLRHLTHLNDAQFVQQLMEIGGGSPEVLQDKDLLALFMPMLRADFMATELYQRQQANAFKIMTPTLLIHADQDKEVSLDDILAWKSWLGGVKEHIVVSGDHFHVTLRPQQFLAVIQNFLFAQLTII